MGNKKRTAKRVVNKMRLPSVLRTKRRQKEVKLRKNFLPTLILIFILWLSLAYMIFFIDPERPAAIPTFFLILFITQVFTVSTMLANTRRGLIISATTTLYLILVYLGVGTIINLVLLIAIAVIIEIYFIKA